MICNCTGYKEIENVMKQRLPNVLLTMRDITVYQMKTYRRSYINIWSNIFRNAVVYKLGYFLNYSLSVANRPLLILIKSLESNISPAW